MPRYVEAKVNRHAVVQCEHCGRQYNYTYVGKATSDVEFLDFSSRKAAGRAAQAATQDESANFYRCPGCGRYQSWMLQYAKSSAAAKGCTWGCVGALVVPLALVGVVFGLGALLSVDADQMMDRVGGPMVLALFACFGLGLLYYFYRRFVWNPNGEKACSRALHTGKLR